MFDEDILYEMVLICFQLQFQRAPLKSNNSSFSSFTERVKLMCIPKGNVAQHVMWDCYVINVFVLVASD